MKKAIYPILISICFLFSNPQNIKAIEGIDVSEFQGTINFNEVASDGIEIVYIRSSASNSYIDAKFEENYQKAKASNLKIGFYHYVTARTTEEAKEQARFFASVIAGKEADCRLAMDFEVFAGLTKEEVNKISLTFLETVEELTEKEVIIYSDAYNASRIFDNEISRKYPLWIAEYDVKEPEVANWEEWLGWQYTDQGQVAGIRDNVDRDTFKDEILLDDKSAIKEPVIKPTDQIKTIYYRVKKGNNLSLIAKLYNVSVKDLIAWNDIKNPNLIYPDQVLKIYTNYKYQVTKSGTNDSYTVKPKDALTKIANQYHVTVSNIVTWNNIQNPDLIYPNQELKIKPINNDHVIRYKVKEKDTLSKIAEEYQTSVIELIILNNIKDPDKITESEIIYIPETYLY